MVLIISIIFCLDDFILRGLFKDLPFSDFSFRVNASSSPRSMQYRKNFINKRLSLIDNSDEVKTSDLEHGTLLNASDNEFSEEELSLPYRFVRYQASPTISAMLLSASKMSSIGLNSK